MEIIEELEPARRGTYGGAVLNADFSGNLDSCIAIRSMLSVGGNGSVQAGAGIVADSCLSSNIRNRSTKRKQFCAPLSARGRCSAVSLRAHF